MKIERITIRIMFIMFGLGIIGGSIYSGIKVGKASFLDMAAEAQHHY